MCNTTDWGSTIRYLPTYFHSLVQYCGSAIIYPGFSKTRNIIRKFYNSQLIKILFAVLIIDSYISVRVEGLTQRESNRLFKKPSVADPGCLSRIPDPDFYPSRIPEPKTATKERGEKSFVATNITKLKNILFLKC